MITPKQIETYNNLPIEFEDFKDVFLPKLLDFVTQTATLKQQKNKNEKAFESELKSLLKNTFYREKYIGNRPYKKGEADLIIASNKKASSKTVVLVEVKSPLDSKDFITSTDIKKKVFFQAVTYFLIEIIEKQNFGIKNMLITDTENFYLFDAVEFHQIFYKSSLGKDFDDGRMKRLLWIRFVSVNQFPTVAENPTSALNSTSDFSNKGTKELRIEKKTQNKTITCK